MMSRSLGLVMRGVSEPVKSKDKLKNIDEDLKVLIWIPHPYVHMLVHVCHGRDKEKYHLRITKCDLKFTFVSLN
jgi:hypothetical protein